jgi:hypothetical protein
MALTWAQRRKELLSDCIVSPDVFNPMIGRLGEFVMPYQDALETEATQHHLHLYLQGLLSHLPSKNAEDIATFVNIERLVIQVAGEPVHSVNDHSISANANISNPLSDHRVPPKCQVRVRDFGAILSRNSKKDSILTVKGLRP